jgi:hypothetical protein
MSMAAMGGGLAADGEFVVSGGHGPVLCELADTAFDGAALFVGVGVEGGCSPPAATAATPPTARQ